MQFFGVFPGQGSQAPGMGRFLYDEFDFVRHAFEQGSDALKKDMKALLFHDPDDELSLTENTQPALVLCSYVTYLTVKNLLDVQIKMAAGHSIGEWSAFVCAGALTLDQALPAVRSRGQFMQEAAPAGVGGMTAALGFSQVQIEHLCKWVQEYSPIDGLIQAANFNCPGQVVLSGHKKQLDWLAQNFSADIFKNLSEPHSSVRRAKFIPLKVSAPFHCDLMKPAQEKMKLVIDSLNWSEPWFAVVQNFEARVASDLIDAKDQLTQQISGTVKWEDCLKALDQAQPLKRAIELGHGQVIQGLVKKTTPDWQVFGFNNLSDLKALEDFVKQQ